MVMVLEQDGMFLIRELVSDPTQAQAASRDAIANHRSWMPEHHHALGKPTGRIYAEAAPRDELTDRARTMRWPETW
jgi:hypothetical protein